MDRGRFSFMGAQGGPMWRAITYHLPATSSTQPPTTSTSNGQQHTSPDSAEGTLVTGLLPLTDVTVSCQSLSPGTGTVHVQSRDGSVASCRLPFFSYLRQLLATHRLQVTQEAAQQLPFNFWGGLVGYLGYELKAECGGAAVHSARTPDAGLLFVDRLLAVDHVTGDVFLLAVYDQRHVHACPGSGGQVLDKTHGADDSYAQAQAWLDDMQRRVSELSNGETKQVPSAAVSHVNGTCAPATSITAGAGAQQASVVSVNGRPAQDIAQPGVAVPDRTLRLRHPKPRYLKNIAACISALHSGDSYEVCLTTALMRQGAPPPHTLYKTLRTLNPAPYGAWLHLGNAGPTICCSSPERFLRGDRGGVLEARPIKGTAARCLSDTVADATAAAELAASEKDRAENLMIVDLLRNDLGTVCEVGSVHVPGLMEIESYATVHQMVSTVRGLRRQDASLVDALQAAFPAGSMTGAPKVRTMSIIDVLEGCARGVYSGSIGFISLNDCFDLNVVIRTAVVDRGNTLGTSATAAVAARTGTTGNVGNGKESGEVADVAVAGGGAEGGVLWEGLDEALVSIGAGGAIVVQSELEGEFDEMRLKARALLAAIGKCDGGVGPAVLDDTEAWADLPCSS